MNWHATTPCLQTVRRDQVRSVDLVSHPGGTAPEGLRRPGYVARGWPGPAAFDSSASAAGCLGRPANRAQRHAGTASQIVMRAPAPTQGRLNQSPSAANRQAAPATLVAPMTITARVAAAHPGCRLRQPRSGAAVDMLSTLAGAQTAGPGASDAMHLIRRLVRPVQRGPAEAFAQVNRPGRSAVIRARPISWVHNGYNTGQIASGNIHEWLPRARQAASRSTGSMTKAAMRVRSYQSSTVEALSTFVPSQPGG